MSKAFIKKSIGNFEEFVSRIETYRDTLQESYDKRSENWQNSEKGEKLCSQIDALESAITDIESVTSELTDAFAEEE